MRFSIFLIVMFVSTCPTAWGGIPLPDTVLYGPLTINGVPTIATDDVTLVARVDGVPDPVGSYQMGDNLGAGDEFALHIRIESTQGGPRSPGVALLGETVHVFVQVDGGAEVMAVDYILTESGIAFSFPIDATVDVGMTFQRGNCNADTAGMDIGDAIFLLSELFSGGATVPCADACDANDDGSKDIGDAIFILSFLFTSGTSPAAPHPGCGPDPTDDTLDCAMFAACP